MYLQIASLTIHPTKDAAQISAQSNWSLSTVSIKKTLMCVIFTHWQANLILVFIKHKTRYESKMKKTESCLGSSFTCQTHPKCHPLFSPIRTRNRNCKRGRKIMKSVWQLQIAILPSDWWNDQKAAQAQASKLFPELISANFDLRSGDWELNNNDDWAALMKRAETESPDHKEQIIEIIICKWLSYELEYVLSFSYLHRLDSESHHREGKDGRCCRVIFHYLRSI